MSARRYRHNPYYPCLVREEGVSSDNTVPWDGACEDWCGYEPLLDATPYPAHEEDPRVYFGGSYSESGHMDDDLSSLLPPPPPYAFPSAERAERKGKRGRKQRSETQPSKTPDDKVADHYKTKVCNNYKLDGWCPFSVLCRFAHGPEDLHTYAQNVRMGLTTEEAVHERQQQLLQALHAKDGSS